MAVDPMIARGSPGIDVTNTLAQIAQMRQRDQMLQQQAQQNALMQQRYQAGVEQETEEDALADRLVDQATAAFQQGGVKAAEPHLFKLSRIDPQTASFIQKAWEEKEAAAGGLKIGNVNPGDYTPESLARYQATIDPATGIGDFRVLNRQYAPPAPPNQTIVQLPTGQAVFNPRTGTTAPLSDRADQRAADAADAGAKAAATATAQRQAKFESEAPKRIARAESGIAGAENVLGAIDAAMKQANGFTTGIMAGAQVIPGTPQYDLARNLDTIEANIGFDRLQQMRDTSPTGGALGQVAVQELAALQQSIRSLKQAQSGGQLRANLAVVRKRYNDYVRATRRAIEQERRGAAKAAPASQGAPDDISALLNLYGQ